MRIRTLKPGFFRSLSLANCSRDARITFAGLWCMADDAGHGPAEPRLIKGDVWPLDDDVTAEVIADHLAELEREHIRFYEVSGRRYYAVTEWEKHQAAAYRRGDPIYPFPLVDDACKKMHDAVPDVQESAGIRNKEGNKDRKGTRTLTRATPPPDEFILSDALKEWASTNVRGLNLKVETEKFLDHHRSKGSTFKDWDAAWRKWMRNAAEWGSSRSPATQGQPTRVARGADPLGYVPSGGRVTLPGEASA